MKDIYRAIEKAKRLTQKTGKPYYVIYDKKDDFGYDTYRVAFLTETNTQPLGSRVLYSAKTDEYFF